MNDCEIWSGRKNKRGYGITREGRYAHRQVFFDTHGYWPDVVRHKCDNPPCVSLDHLEPGTQADNLRDAVKRGRARRAQGEDVATAKLTVDKVKDIRYRVATETVSSLAREYGVDRKTIRKIRDGQTWKAGQ